MQGILQSIVSKKDYKELESSTEEKNESSTIEKSRMTRMTVRDFHIHFVDEMNLLSYCKQHK